jgi:hypothetical protein
VAGSAGFNGYPKLIPAVNKKIKLVQRNKIIKVQRNRINTAQRNRIIETRSLKKVGHGQTP